MILAYSIGGSQNEKSEPPPLSLLHTIAGATARSSNDQLGHLSCYRFVEAR
jgi:hypothetical protein